MGVSLWSAVCRCRYLNEIVYLSKIASLRNASCDSSNQINLVQNIVAVVVYILLFPGQIAA